MFLIQTNKSVDFGLAMSYLVNKNKYTKNDFESLKDYIRSAKEATSYLEENMSVKLYKSMKEYVSKYFFHNYIVKLASIYPDMTESEVIEHIRHSSDQDFYMDMLLYNLRLKDDDDQKIKESIHTLNSTNTMKEAPSFTSVTYFRRHKKELKEDFTSFLEEFLPLYLQAKAKVKGLEDESIEVFKNHFKSIDDFLGQYNLLDSSIFEGTKRFLVYVSVYVELGLYVTFYDQDCHIIMGSGLTYILTDDYKNKQKTLFYKCFSDTSKLEILKYIKEEDLCAADLVDKMSLTKSTVSHHLNQLLSANIIMLSKKEGKKIYYRVHTDYMKDMFAQTLKDFS